jgi:TrmH family RNA methyltransferase
MVVQESRHERVVAEIEAVAATGGRARLGLCSVEGIRLCERALRAGARLERAVVAREFLEEVADRATSLRTLLETHGCELHVVPDAVMTALTAGRSLGGIIALARLPDERSIEDVLAHPLTTPLRMLACVGFNDPGNVGALVRTAHAGGASAVVAVGSTDAFHPRAIRTSMGSIFRVPILARPDVPMLVAELRAAGVRTVGAVTRDGVPLPRLEDRAAPTAIFLGSEAFGLSPEQSDLLDERVTIPMAAGVDSFSVNAAAAVLLYELSTRNS